MRSLYEFEAPPDGEIPVCEVNSRVHTISVNLDFTNINAFTAAVTPQVSPFIFHPPTSFRWKNTRASA